MAKRWTDEEVEILKENYGVMPNKELSELLGKTWNSINHKVVREKIPNPKMWTDEEIQYLKDHYKDQTYKEISEHLGRTKAAIDLKINKLGLVKSKYHYNHDFFENITTEDQAYWCGFIMADGCVTIQEEINSCELCIKLQAGDAEHLRKFNKAIEGNVPVKIFERYNEHTICKNKLSHESQIRLYSEKMVHDIAKYGVIPNKTLVKQFPTNIPDHLMNHYIRGYFDGNGSIYVSNGYYRCSFVTGSLDFAKGMVQYLKTKGIYAGKITTQVDTNAHRFAFYSKANVHKFLTYIYNNSTISLDRKYYKAQQYFKVHNLERRLLRQSEMIGQPRNGSNGKETGKAEMLIRMEPRIKDTRTCRA